MTASLKAQLRVPLFVGAAYAAVFLGFVLPYCWGIDIPARLGWIGVWLNPLTYFAAFLIAGHSAFWTSAALGLGTVASFVLATCACLMCMMIARLSKWLLLVPLALLLWYSSHMLPAFEVL